MEHDDGTSGDSDDRIGRLKSLAWDGAQENLVDYYHVGLNLFAIVDLSDPDVDVQLDRTASHTGERRRFWLLPAEALLEREGRAD